MTGTAYNEGTSLPRIAKPSSDVESKLTPGHFFISSVGHIPSALSTISFVSSLVIYRLNILRILLRGWSDHMILCHKLHARSELVLRLGSSEDCGVLSHNHFAASSGPVREMKYRTPAGTLMPIAYDAPVH
jgi:hypothetical protein